MGREAGPGKIVASRRVESSASGDGSHGTIQPAAVLGEVLIGGSVTGELDPIFEIKQHA